MAPKSVTFRRHDHLVSVLFGDLLSHSYNITFSMFLYLVEGVTELFQSHAGSSTVKPFAGLDLQEKFYEEVFHLVVSDNFV